MQLFVSRDQVFLSPTDLLAPGSQFRQKIRFKDDMVIIIYFLLLLCIRQKEVLMMMFQQF